MTFRLALFFSLMIGMCYSQGVEPVPHHSPDNVGSNIKNNLHLNDQHEKKDDNNDLMKPKIDQLSSNDQPSAPAQDELVVPRVNTAEHFEDSNHAGSKQSKINIVEQVPPEGKQDPPHPQASDSSKPAKEHETQGRLLSDEGGILQHGSGEESKPCQPTEAPSVQAETLTRGPDHIVAGFGGSESGTIPQDDREQVMEAPRPPPALPEELREAHKVQLSGEDLDREVAGEIDPQAKVQPPKEEHHEHGEQPTGSGEQVPLQVMSEAVPEPDAAKEKPSPDQQPAEPLAPHPTEVTPAPGQDTTPSPVLTEEEKLATQTAEEAIKKEEDDIKPPTETQDMPSFDEWKQKMLAEQEEQERNQILEAMALSPSSPSPPKSKPSKKSSNYASATCGAKVLSTNPEAQNPSFILTENRDQYIINPCKARKWFIVELCEPVQIHSLEMGNLELFSSLPSSFVAQMSDRYPTKEWKHLGMFHARDERTIQSFAVGDEQLFAKYLKIEIKTHYGSEHYCPLSIIRVYGVTVEDDDSDEVEQHHGTLEVSLDDPLEAAPSNEDDKDAPSNLFNSAKNTVMSIVKNVLSPGSHEEEEQVVTTDVEQLNLDPKANASAKNMSMEMAGEETKDEMLPCPPNADSSAPPSDNSPEYATPDQPEAPNVTVPNRNTPIKLTEPPTTDPPRVTLMEGPGTPLHRILNKCNYCQGFIPDQCMFRIHTICGYLRLWKFVRPTSCLDAEKPPQPVQPDVIDSAETEAPSPKSGDEANTPSQPSENSDKVPVSESTTDTDHKPASVTVSLEGLEKSADSILSSRTQNQEAEMSPSSARDSNFIVTEKTIHEVTQVEEDLEPSQTNIASQTEGLEQASQTVPLPPSTSSIFDIKASVESCDQETLDGTACQLGPEVVQIRPTSTEDVPVTTKDPDVITPPPVDLSADKKEGRPEEKDKPSEIISPEGKPANDQKAETNSAHNGNGNGATKVIFADESSDRLDLDLEAVPPPTGVEINYQKLTSSRKENTYMRLKNKIKTLELNLNLSSRYLEELSQRYKRQMEDMYLSLNRTIAKLANTSRSAETRDLKQQERIAELEKQITDLKSVMTTFKDGMDSVHTQVIERHLFLMAVEAVIFICILAWCVARQQKIELLQRKTAATVDKFTHSVKEKPPDSQIICTVKNKVNKKRRNSIDACTPRRRERSPSLVGKTERTSYDDTDLNTSQGREHDLTIIEPNIPIFITDINQSSRTQEISNAQKKKKKKKQKLLGTVCGANLLVKNAMNLKWNPTNVGVISGVQDVPEMEPVIYSNASSRHSSTTSLTSSTSSSSYTHKDQVPLPSVSNMCSKPSKDKKVTARKSLDSALSHMKGHKRIKSNGSMPSDAGLVNGHWEGQSLAEELPTSGAVCQLQVNGAAGQLEDGSSAHELEAQVSRKKGGFHKCNGSM